MPGKRTKKRIKKNEFEMGLWPKRSVAAGIDEVGRGCLAGPVVAAAVILPPGPIKRFLRDSKILSEKSRETAYAWILGHCSVGIGMADHRTIDEINIYQANKIAMKRAFFNLMQNYRGSWPVDAILIDAVPLHFTNTIYKNIAVHAYPKGEDWSSSIAAASIVAKVTRDRLMAQFDAVFPGYQLGAHKGYATKPHQSAIISNKHSLIHRMSFLNNILAKQDKDESDAQSSIF